MRHVGSDPQVERGRGEVNLSPILVLTLRPRVGGFYVSGRLWEVHSVVFHEVLRLLDVQLLTKLRRGWGSLEKEPRLFLRARV